MARAPFVAFYHVLPALVCAVFEVLSVEGLVEDALLDAVVGVVRASIPTDFFDVQVLVETLRIRYVVMRAVRVTQLVVARATVGAFLDKN